MSELQKRITLFAMVPCFAIAGPGLDQAEVKLPYGELKSLITAANVPPPEIKSEPIAALLAMRFRLSLDGKTPVLDSTFRTTTFSDGLAMVPLVGGDVTIENQKPLDARILVSEKTLCQALEKSGTQILEMRLLPSFGKDGAVLSIHPCPASIFETGDLGAEKSVALSINGDEQVLGSNQLAVLPLTGGILKIRMLGSEEAREALRPPEPSTWTWQHQTLVMPGESEIAYQVLGRASATDGSGMNATLVLPADAREVKAGGEDLASQKLIRGADRSLALRIDWKTRGLLEREVAITYRLPRRPLDRTWKLQAPTTSGDDSTRTRFIVVGSPELSYSADGMAGPLSPKSLPPGFANELNGQPCYQVEAESAVDLKINPLPLVATAEATVSEALWMLRLESDGALLIEGSMNLEHRGLLGVVLDVPPSMALLSCEVTGQSVTPVNLGDGKLEINLPATGGKTRVSCTFTGKIAALDPVEGTFALSLPKTPLFVRALTWKIDLPRGYQAETHGNLVRAGEPNDPPSRLTLRKNLCRDERPETNVFYQRSDLKN